MFKEVSETSAHLRVFPGLSAMAGRDDGILECDVSSFSAQRQCYERPGETQMKVLCLLGTHCLRVSVATGACDFGLWGAAAWTIYCHLGLPDLR